MKKNEKYPSAPKSLKVIPPKVQESFIPELKGAEAEEFILKADEALNAPKVDFSNQCETCRQIIIKSRSRSYCGLSRYRNEGECTCD